MAGAADEIRPISALQYIGTATSLSEGDSVQKGDSGEDTSVPA